MRNIIEICQKLNCKFKENEELKQHSSFRTGGKADLFVWAENAEQCVEILKAAKIQNIPVHILGKATNLLISDDGVRGIVLKLESQKKFLRDGNLVRVWAGESLASLCKFAAEESLSGLEFAYGIPGSVGGAVYMNAGAYGGEIKNCLKSVTFIDDDFSIKTLPAEDLDLSYRHSIFCGKNQLILEAVFELENGEKSQIQAAMDDVMQKRIDKQPLEFPSAGSTFKRPEGAFASALIDQCGLKGFRIGGACVSPKHAGFIVNDKDGTCQDILDLIAEVQKVVFEKTGYSLETEVEFWGEK